MIFVIKTKAPCTCDQYTGMKRIKTREHLAFGILAAFALVSGCLGLGSVLDAGFTPGTYEGSGRGYRGPVHVRLEISAAGIEDIVILSHRESAYPGVAAMEELLELILADGSTDLDLISGATMSSRGFLEAVEDAVGQARR